MEGIFEGFFRGYTSLPEVWRERERYRSPRSRPERLVKEGGKGRMLAVGRREERKSKK